MPGKQHQGGGPGFKSFKKAKKKAPQRKTAAQQAKAIEDGKRKAKAAAEQERARNKANPYSRFWR